jgi:3,5-epimerase/4-reductase
MNKNILILGGGFIGQRLKEAYDCQLSDKQIHSYQEAMVVVDEFNPEVLINCIGFTGVGNVDGCEAEIDMTLEANTFIPLILGEIAFRKKIKLVHISSGCIYHYNYDKQSPLKEEDEADFYDLYYSRSKIYSENVLLPLSKRVNILIARIRIPLDNRSHPKNILNKLIKYKKVIDIPNSVTYIPDFIDALAHLIKIDARGIYNLVNKGGLRYPLLMDTYKKYVPDFQYKLLALKDLNLVRTNLILSTEKLENTGFKVRSINDVLEECVQGFIAN